jgi:hypothetical protein
MTLRLRLPMAAAAVFGLIAVLLAVGALFPTVEHSIGKLSIPKGVAQLLGGADYGTPSPVGTEARWAPSMARS